MALASTDLLCDADIHTRAAVARVKPDHYVNAAIRRLCNQESLGCAFACAFRYHDYDSFQPVVPGTKQTVVGEELQFSPRRCV